MEHAYYGAIVIILLFSLFLHSRESANKEARLKALIKECYELNNDCIHSYIECNEAVEAIIDNKQGE